MSQHHPVCYRLSQGGQCGTNTRSIMGRNEPTNSPNPFQSLAISMAVEGEKEWRPKKKKGVPLECKTIQLEIMKHIAKWHVRGTEASRD